MWLQRLTGSSKVRRDPRWTQLEPLANAAVAGSQTVLSQIAGLVAGLRTDLGARAVDADLWKLIGAAVAVLCDDDILDTAEEANLKNLCAALGMHLRDLRAMNFPAWEELAVARINDHRPPTLPDPPMIAKPGETAYAAFRVSLLKEVVQREFRGRSSGFSVPLGLGIRYRTGSSRGKSVVVGTDLVVADSGALVLTDQRALFLGDQKTLEFRRDKLVGLEQFTDGLRLNVSNRQAPSLFRFAKGESPALAAALVVSG